MKKGPFFGFGWGIKIVRFKKCILLGEFKEEQRKLRDFFV